MKSIDGIWEREFDPNNLLISPKSVTRRLMFVFSFGITGTTGLQRMELLSGGQKSRVAFACLSLTNPHILVLDEPSNHLDIEGMDALSEALQRFEGGVVMVSHDVTMLRNVCTSLWVCDKGTVHKFDGTVDAYKKMISSQANEAGVVAQH
jgi:ATP-binding cassette subfamily F protein 3